MTNVEGTPIYVGEGLSAAGTWLNSEAQQAADELNRLRQQLAPLAEAWSQSKAADYYQGLQEEWNLAADGLFGPDGVLGKIAHAMHVNWGNYSEAEWANISTWRH